MRILYSITGLCLLLGIWGCSSYKAQKQESFLTVPELGSLVIIQDNMTYKSRQQVGMPVWESAPKVFVQELPFNKASYIAYSEYMARAGKINSIPYVDSLPYKPKYLRLQLLDKIALTGLLNSESNLGARTYLEKNEDYKMVTTLDVVTTDALMPLLLGAETVLLQQDEFKNPYLQLIGSKSEVNLTFFQVQVFNYELSGFCWGENKYYRKEIQALVDTGESCPKGTFAKASKATSDRDYLKL